MLGESLNLLGLGFFICKIRASAALISLNSLLSGVSGSKQENEVKMKKKRRRKPNANKTVMEYLDKGRKKEKDRKEDKHNR